MEHDTLHLPNKMPRRAFNKRLLGLGLTLTGIEALLEACGNTQQNGSMPAAKQRVTSTGETATNTVNTQAALRTKEGFSLSPKWEQNFRKMPNGPLDSSVWNIDTGTQIPSYNNEAETLTDRPKNVRVEGGALLLQAYKESLDDKKYTSAHVNTQGKFSFQYGKLEVDLKGPAGIGTWPAAWLLPEGTRYQPGDYGIDPNSDNAWAINGEIDFFEAVGSEPGKVFPDVHSYKSVVANQNGTDFVQVPDMARNFHTYGVELLPGHITFTLDGRPYHSASRESTDPRSWPFDQPYYLILNLAMGGIGGEKRDSYPPDGIEGNGPWEMAVQDVRYYDYERPQS